MILIEKIKNYLKWILLALLLAVVLSGVGYITGVAELFFVRIGGFVAYVLPILIITYIILWIVGKTKGD